MIERTFDLTASSRRTYVETTRGFRRIIGITIIAIIVIDVLGLIYQLTRGTIRSNLQTTYGIEIWFGIAAVVIFSWFWKMFGPGATRLTIDAGEFTSRFPRRKLSRSNGPIRNFD